jgi:hypothetical protein
MYAIVMGPSSCGVVSVCGQFQAQVFPIVMGRSSCCIVLPVCGPIYALVYPIVMGRSSCCIVLPVCGPIYALMQLTVKGLLPVVFNTNRWHDALTI